MSSPRPIRHRPFAIPGYYEGYLEKLEFKSKKYKRYWTVLRGNSLCFQLTSRDPTYIEKISLDDFVSVVNEDSHDKDLQTVNLILKLKHGDVKLKADSPESREQWKGFILTVAKLEIPDLALLPGQIHRLQEVLMEEVKHRRKSIPPPLPTRSRTPEPVQDDYDDVENSLPRCYYKISRVEAEIMLERNMEYGNLLMRPGGDNKNISVTTRQIFNNNALVKHYRIRCADNGYIIEVDSGVLCNSTQEVIDYFVQHTHGVLKPLERVTDYEINLSFVREDAESGELIHQKKQAPTKSATKTSPQPVKEEKLSPKIPIILEPEAEYLNDDEIEKLNQVKIQSRPMKELVPLHPKTQLQANSSNTFPGLISAASSELQEKLKKRRAMIYESYPSQ
ncbi:signal-transducing adaptor protein 1-like isoform X2 [Heterodontus francisci]|uniref:signal-transducing adaptor protein 1-like isoform X2 n=1 Tax=Heterodontus francisci TaxID=7792 RepID=UPI00355B1000